MKDFTKRWKEKTECSEGYKTTDCKNGPKATPTPSAAAPGQDRAAGAHGPSQGQAPAPDRLVDRNQAKFAEAPPPGGASR